MNPSTIRTTSRLTSLLAIRSKHTVSSHVFPAMSAGLRPRTQGIYRGGTSARPLSTSTPRETTTHIADVKTSEGASSTGKPILPVTCPGCGALSQTELSDKAGYYSSSRKAVQDYFAEHTMADFGTSSATTSAANTVDVVKSGHNISSPAQFLIDKQPYCDRCHNLMHHNRGVPIAHPTLADLETSMVESPHEVNHIWHVIDAADFPLSLVRDLDKRLSWAYLRSRNRRSKDSKYVAGKQAQMSFIITRADLLAPNKGQVDQMMPKLQSILRTALQSRGEQPRLGNVYAVSADRGWWTKSIKDILLKDRGAHWLVGKANVGKSKLFETIFPKHTNKKSAEVQSSDEMISKTISHIGTIASTSTSTADVRASSKEELDPTFSLLPPRQQIMQYPVMPIISSLPGTTVSPIRIPFRDGKCELIDLPGLRRGSMEDFVRPDRRGELIMTERVVPERIVIKPGQSLILGGLIRLSPKIDGPVIMAHCFTPLSTHLTSNAKADAFFAGDVQFKNQDEFALSDAHQAVKTAGVFRLTDDVTRLYAGPLTRRDGIGLSPERLPFTILATDILVEGVGWIELQVQIRKPKSLDMHRLLATGNIGEDDEPVEGNHSDHSTDVGFPEVEIFSPQGKFIGQRMSLCAFATGGPRVRKRGARPRQSMVSVKHRQKSQNKVHTT